MRHAVDRLPTDPTAFAITIWPAAVQGEHDFVRALVRGYWRVRFPDGALDRKLAVPSDRPAMATGLTQF
jgi:hypothetical protein